MGQPEEISSVSMSYSDMNRNSTYSYELEDADGEILFSCYYFDEDADFKEVTLEDIPVDGKYMDELREIVAEHELLSRRRNEPGSIDLEVLDAPMYSLVLRWITTTEGRTFSDSLRLDYFPPGAEELRKHFKAMARLYACDAGTLHP